MWETFQTLMSGEPATTHIVIIEIAKSLHKSFEDTAAQLGLLGFDY